MEKPKSKIAQHLNRAANQKTVATAAHDYLAAI